MFNSDFGVFLRILGTKYTQMDIVLKPMKVDIAGKFQVKRSQSKFRSDTGDFTCGPHIVRPTRATCPADTHAINQV